jgi:hypothetical protein
MKEISEETKKRFDAIRERAVKLGVLDINFISANTSADALECYSYTLDIIEKNKALLDKNAGVAEV